MMKKNLALSLFYSGALLAATSPSETTFSQGQTLPQNIFTPQYNAPARILLQKKTLTTDVSINLAFLYYYAGEDGLDIANSADLISNGGAGYIVGATSNSKAIVQNFAYKPDFRLGIGLDWDEWTSNAEYTWIRSTTTTSASPNTPNPTLGTAVWIFNNWFQQTTSTGQTISATNFNSDWNVALDLLIIKQDLY
jgi:hypothetical protein